MAPTCIHLYGMISLVVLPTRTFVDIAQPLLGALIVAPAITIVEIADATSTKIAPWINIVRVASICLAIVMISDARTGDVRALSLPIVDVMVIVMESSWEFRWLALFFSASFIKNSPAITKGSLFAINTFFPDFIE